ncbi:hypothetical protein LTR62_004720 [Meristemomyces frigidus]|uniref:Cytochrome P450 n=1 Tax=Meristemomyces frigidus TaxID=1508187 RepID=A0AAN7TGL3_9PEZI|nr:hypothetical protein LTR62_004720 [Meristemomyces frigidus]
MVRRMNAAGSKWTRGTWYDGMKLDPRQDSVFSTRDETLHADMRSKEIGGYNGRDIDTLEPDLDACITDLMELIRHSYHESVLDLAETARYFTLDVLSTVAFGRPFGFMATNSDLWSYGKTNADFMPFIELVVNHPTMQWLVATPLMQMLAAPKVTDKTGMGPALGFARKPVAERYDHLKQSQRKDMLDHFIKKGLTQLQCESEANLQIIAGSDSTTTILRCTLFSLIANPVAYGKLRTEIDRAADAGHLSCPVTTYAEAQRLPYLTAVLWEGIRMFPPLFGLKSKLAPPGGDTFKGVFYPEGTEVGLCDASMTRNKAMFGQDSHFFRPERWLEADAARRIAYRRTVESIFGTGRFQCLGRHIAMMELFKTIVELLRKFDWSIADPFAGVQARSNAVVIHRGMNVIARAR